MPRAFPYGFICIYIDLYGFSLIYAYIYINRERESGREILFVFDIFDVCSSYADCDLCVFSIIDFMWIWRQFTCNIILILEKMK